MESAIREISFRWEVARRQYAAFEPAVSSPASEVYQHEMPGGQYTNLKEQARSLGLDARWHEVAKAYAEAARRLRGEALDITIPREKKNLFGMLFGRRAA